MENCSRSFEAGYHWREIESLPAKVAQLTERLRRIEQSLANSEISAPTARIPPAGRQCLQEGSSHGVDRRVAMHAPTRILDLQSKMDGRSSSQIEALFSAGREQGSGTLVDIFVFGRAHRGRFDPSAGRHQDPALRLRATPTRRVVGEVVRHTETGYAIANLDISDEIRAWIE